jgi:hypothetical protein
MTRDDALAAGLVAAEERVARANHAAAELEERLEDGGLTAALAKALTRAEAELEAAGASLAAARQRRAAVSP